MIVTLTPNPALDLTYHLDALHVGASQRVPPAQLRAGGKGINVARVLHDQGHRVVAVAPVGGTTGATFIADLDAAGVPRSLLEVDAATRQTLALVTPTETTNLNETGTALAPAHWRQLSDLVAAALTHSADDTPTHGVQERREGAAGRALPAFLHPADVGASEQGRPQPRHQTVLVCSGSMPPDTPAEAIGHLVDVAHQVGARCIVDTSSAPHLLAAADAGADVLKPNHHELLAAVGGDDMLAAARALAARGGAVVYASLGAAGLLRVATDQPTLHARLNRSLSGNTTGAGDAAVAAIAASLEAGSSPEDTLRLAVAWSAAAVLHPLAGSIVDPAPLRAGITVEPVVTIPALED